MSEGTIYLNDDGVYHALSGFKALDLTPETEDLTPEINDAVYRTFYDPRTFSGSCTMQVDLADMHKLDVLLRPYVIYCNPKDEQLFEEFKKKGFIIYTNAIIEKGTCYIIDRSKLELEADLWY